MRAIAISALVAVFTGSAFAQSIYSNQSSNVNAFALNGKAVSNAGQAAPAGGRWSEVQNDSPTSANTNAGFGFVGALRMADNFTIAAGQTWNITAFHFASYLTGGAGVPHNNWNIRIWSGAPNAGGTVVFGDTTTNRFVSATDIHNYEGGGSGNLFRVFNTVVPATPGGTPTAPGTTRRIWDSTVAAVVSLGPGTYWIDYSSGNAGGFSPATTHQGVRGVAGANGLQFNGTWVAMADAGQPAGVPIVNQEAAFRIDGTVVPEPATMAILGLGVVPFLRRRKK